MARAPRTFVQVPQVTDPLPMRHFREGTAHDSPPRPKNSRLSTSATVSREPIQYWLMLRGDATPLDHHELPAPHKMRRIWTPSRGYTRAARTSGTKPLDPIPLHPPASGEPWAPTNHILHCKPQATVYTFLSTWWRRGAAAQGSSQRAARRDCLGLRPMSQPLAR